VGGPRFTTPTTISSSTATTSGPEAARTFAPARA
jgi:hypothetical protein